MPRKTSLPPRPLHSGIVECRIIGLVGPGLVEVVADDGSLLEARLPQHIDARWLRAALSVGPVDAAAALVGAGQRALLWCVFPGSEHRHVVPDLELRGRRVRVRASEGVELECGRTALLLDPRGSVRVRGQDVRHDEVPAPAAAPRKDPPN